MDATQVRVRGFYVNEARAIIREIIHEAANGYVYWQAYRLQDGEPLPGGWTEYAYCSKEAFAHWAGEQGREATAEEIARLRRGERYVTKQQEERTVVDDSLKGVPHDLLVAEVRRRG